MKKLINYERWLFEFFNLKIEDIDGEENGGDFRTQEIVVKVTEKDKVKAGEGWYAGKYVKTQDIALISKDTAVVRERHQKMDKVYINRNAFFYNKKFLFLKKKCKCLKKTAYFACFLTC